jgi:hypothetical protein
MTLANYAELKASVADFLNRDDLASVIPSFIRLAESRVDRDVRHWRQEKRSEAQLDSQYSVIPSDYISTIRFQVLDGSTSELQPISTAQMLQLRDDRRDVTGRPTHYALTAGTFELYPTPDATYNISLVYYSRVSALSDVNTTNWLLTQAPDLYLYGTLVHSAPYLKDDAKISIWDGLYKSALDNLNANSSEAKYGGSGLTMKTRRGAP